MIDLILQRGFFDELLQSFEHLRYRFADLYKYIDHPTLGGWFASLPLEISATKAGGVIIAHALKHNLCSFEDLQKNISSINFILFEYLIENHYLEQMNDDIFYNTIKNHQDLDLPIVYLLMNHPSMMDRLNADFAIHFANNTFHEHHSSVHYFISYIIRENIFITKPLEQFVHNFQKTYNHANSYHEQAFAIYQQPDSEWPKLYNTYDLYRRENIKNALIKMLDRDYKPTTDLRLDQRYNIPFESIDMKDPCFNAVMRLSQYRKKNINKIIQSGLIYDDNCVYDISHFFNEEALFNVIKTLLLKYNDEKQLGFSRLMEALYFIYNKGFLHFAYYEETRQLTQNISTAEDFYQIIDTILDKHGTKKIPPMMENLYHYSQSTFALNHMISHDKNYHEILKALTYQDFCSCKTQAYQQEMKVYL